MYKFARLAGLFLALALPLLAGCRSVTTRTESRTFPEHHHSATNDVLLHSGSLQLGTTTDFGGPAGLGNSRGGMLQ